MTSPRTHGNTRPGLTLPGPGLPVVLLLALLAGCAAHQPRAPDPRDPWEAYNRQAHAFNMKVDQYVARPLAETYVDVVPQPLRSGVRNFFTNLFQPLTAVHLLLQGRPKDSAVTVGRFAMNTTLGLAGILDPASDAGIRLYREDLGQTLGVWGWRNSRYLVIPFLGPSTLRDGVGEIGDGHASPFQLADTPERYYVMGLYLVDLRSGALAADQLVGDVGDTYAFYRNAHLQRRDYLIGGERDEALPAYLQDLEYLDDLEEPAGAPVPEPAPGTDAPRDDE